MRVNLIMGALGTGARGIDRVSNNLQSALAGETLRLRLIGLRGPSAGPFSVPFLYTALPAAAAWVSLGRPRAVNHILSQSNAHLLNFVSLPRSVVTCHDLIEWTQLEKGLRRLRPHRKAHIRLWVRGLLRADRIVTDSEFVRRQLIDELGFPAARVRTVCPGVDLARFRPLEPDDAVLGRYGLRRDQPFVLYVGSEPPRKNVPSAIRAVALARRLRPRLLFVKVGPHQTIAGRKELLEAIRSCGLGDAVRLIDEVADPDLPHLYAAASVFVFPSLMEGFGYPPVEAMACGAPVVASGAACLPEVLGDAALLVDATRPEAIAAAIDRVLGDREVAASLRARGLTRARRYDVRDAARLMIEVYRDLREDRPFGTRRRP